MTEEIYLRKAELKQLKAININLSDISLALRAIAKELAMCLPQPVPEDKGSD